MTSILSSARFYRNQSYDDALVEERRKKAEDDALMISVAASAPVAIGSSADRVLSDQVRTTPWAAGLLGRTKLGSPLVEHTFSLSPLKPITKVGSPLIDSLPTGVLTWMPLPGENPDPNYHKAAPQAIDKPKKSDSSIGPVLIAVALIGYYMMR